jgi:hypothetical protein
MRSSDYVNLLVLALLAGTLLSSCSHADSPAASQPASGRTLTENAGPPSGPVARVDSLNGVPGQPFGSPLSAFANLQLAERQTPGCRTYRYANGKSGPGWFGKHQRDVPGVFYCFKNGKFFSFRAIGYRAGQELLRQEAFYLFGPPQQGIDELLWNGEKVQARLQPWRSENAQILDVTHRALEAEPDHEQAARLKAENALP